MASNARDLSLLDPQILGPAAIASLRKLVPQHVARNPVMFVVEVGSVLTTLVWLRDLVAPSADAAPAWFTFWVSAWLWFTVIFANFAEAVAEGRGQAQAATLRKMRKETTARRVVGNREERVPASQLRRGDTVVVEAGEFIPGDGDVIEGIDWVIVGGESGPGSRAMAPEWVMSIRNQCHKAGAAFFFKQWGGVQKKRTGRTLDGRTYDEMPANSLVQLETPWSGLIGRRG
jgi:high-affinity K+ transport system ATPase subunit B